MEHVGKALIECWAGILPHGFGFLVILVDFALAADKRGGRSLRDVARIEVTQPSPAQYIVQRSIRMVRENEIRKAEVAVEMPPATDAGLVFIGRIHTPWTSRMETPLQGRADGPLCRIEVFEPWVAALDSLAQFERIEVLYWLHLSRRDLVMQSPANVARDILTEITSPAKSNRHGHR